LLDGRMLSGGSDYPRGNPENPVSTAELQQKFRALIEPRFGSGVADRSLDAIQQISQISDMVNAFSNLI